ncbi:MULTISPECIES: hypothetical protein [unclassified Pseudomonas]|uniref:hypothetical protein n=1 Tax=unclassified Pseudomonas TaxID=196821 RepID=UPI001CBAAE53|nr:MULTISPECIES: hypothetical protein [unclassified Pseudomonas]
MSLNTLNPWEYPALASERAMGLLWLLLAAMTIVAGLTASDVFYGTTDHEGPISLGFKLWVIAISFKVLGTLAPLTRITQRWHLRRLRQESKRKGLTLRVKPTYRAALVAGGVLMAASQAITLFLEHS